MEKIMKKNIVKKQKKDAKSAIKKNKKDIPFKIAFASMLAGASVMFAGIITGGAGGVVEMTNTSRDELLERYSYEQYCEEFNNDEDAFLKAQDENAYYKLVNTEKVVEKLDKAFTITLLAGTSEFAVSALAAMGFNLKRRLEILDEMKEGLQSISENLDKIDKALNEMSDELENSNNF